MENIIDTVTKFAPQLLFLTFLLITFSTSAIDKLTDWNGNIAYFNDHFSKTFLKDRSKLMLGFLTLMEVIASILVILGIVQICFYGNTELGLWAAIISAKTLLLLLLGQRIAKDYVGAMTIAVYFGIALYGIFLLII